MKSLIVNRSPSSHGAFDIVGHGPQCLRSFRHTQRVEAVFQQIGLAFAPDRIRHFGEQRRAFVRRLMQERRPHQRAE